MSRARVAILTTSLVLAILLAGLAGTSVYRKVATFQPVGFSSQAAGATQLVEAVHHPATGLMLGDRILQVNGELPRDLPTQLRSQAESALLVERTGEILAVDYQRPPVNVDWPYIVLALVGTAYLLIGLYTVFRSQRKPGFLFFLWCLSSAALYLLSPSFVGLEMPDSLGKVIYLGDQMARLWLPPLTLHLFLVFPAQLGSLRLHRARPFLYLPAAVLTVLHGDLMVTDGATFFGSNLVASVQLLERLELVSWVAFGLAAVLVLVLRLLKQRDWEKQRQVHWMALGLAGGYVPFAALYLLPWLLGLSPPTLVQVAAVLPLGLVPLAFAYSILRYKLWDIEVIVRDTISSTLTLMLGIVGFSLVHFAINRGLASELQLARTLFSFLAGLSIAGLLLPTRRVISDGLERLQYRTNFFKRRALSELAEELLRERDLTRLCQRLADRLEEAVPLARVNLYVLEPEAGLDLSLVRDEGAMLPRTLDTRQLPERLWRETVHPISGLTVPVEEAPTEQQLFIAGYRYIFPLQAANQRVGLVLASYKPDESPLNSDDVELIRQLLDQASLAIENAQLVGQLHQRLDEVSRLQRYSEGIFEANPAGIVVLDPEDRVVSANHAFARLTAGQGVDASDPAALRGRPLEELMPARPLPEPGEGPLEVAYCDPTGEEHYYQLSLSVFSQGDGSLRILVVHDVSERVAMENALRESDRLAALGMLAAGVAHEVNTPITGISSYAQMLLADTGDDDPRYDLLKKVERQTFRAARIVNNLLEFARNKGSEHCPVSVVPLIGETLDLLKERLSRGGVQVAWDPPEADIQVWGNHGELQQVLTNLFVNAVDAMVNDGGGTLSIDIEEKDAPRDRDQGIAVITVEDTGVGIPPERMKTIFQPFFSTKLDTGGTGLGLSISHEIVRRHGGDLRVTSQPGEGTRFLVELPKVRENA